MKNKVFLGVALLFFLTVSATGQPDDGSMMIVET